MNETPNDVRRGFTSASNALADSLCAGRHLAQRGLPDKRSKDSETGNRIHAALKLGDPSGLSVVESDTYDACREIEERKVREFFGDDAPKAKVWSEERFWVRFDSKGQGGPLLEHSGQLDKVYRYQDKALVIEYKTLMGDVPESSRNPQLRDQAVLFRGNVVLVDKVGVVVVQPFVERDPAICLYEAADLDRAAAEMFSRVVASNDVLSRRVAGAAQCKFCLAKTVCEEYSKWSASNVPLVLEPVVQASLFQVAMANWSPEQRALAAGILPQAVKTLEEIKDFLKEGMKADPSFVPGYQIGKGRRTEKITDPGTCFQRFNKLGGTVEQFMGFVTVGKTKLKEGLKAVTGSKGKALDTHLAKLTEGIIEESVSEGSIEKVSQ